MPLNYMDFTYLHLVTPFLNTVANTVKHGRTDVDISWTRRENISEKRLLSCANGSVQQRVRFGYLLSLCLYFIFLLHNTLVFETFSSVNLNNHNLKADLTNF